MWPKIKKGVRNVRISIRVPEDEWAKFRKCSPALTPSEQVRLAILQYTSTAIRGGKNLAYD